MFLEDSDFSLTSSNYKLKKKKIIEHHLPTMTQWRKRNADRGGGYNLDKNFTQKICSNFYQESINLYQGYGTYLTYCSIFLKVCARFGLAERKNFVRANIF